MTPSKQPTPVPALSAEEALARVQYVIECLTGSYKVGDSDLRDDLRAALPALRAAVQERDAAALEAEAETRRWHAEREENDRLRAEVERLREALLAAFEVANGADNNPVANRRAVGSVAGLLARALSSPAAGEPEEGSE